MTFIWHSVLSVVTHVKLCFLCILIDKYCRMYLVKVKGQYSSPGEPHLRATGRHLPYGITQCYLPPDTSERAPVTPSVQDGTQFTYPGGMEGWVDLVGLIAPGRESKQQPFEFRSRVRCRTAAPPRQCTDIYAVKLFSLDVQRDDQKWSSMCYTRNCQNVQYMHFLKWYW